MTVPHRDRSQALPALLAAWVVAAVSALPVAAQDRPTAAPNPSAAPAPPPNAAPGGPAWNSLSPAQQQALAPLQRDWPTIDANRKAKWIDVAARFPRMPAEERARIQARMTEWARLTPAERGRARLQFQEARQFPAEDRQARWEAYRALPEEKRAELARQSAKAPQKAASGAEPRAAAAAGGKRNVVAPTPQAAALSKPVSPTAIQGKPGATTTLVSQQPRMPVHQQAGLPKIAATEGFVDPKTLLPRRGPQGAAVRSAAAPSQPQASP